MKTKIGILAMGILISSTGSAQDTTLTSRPKNKITFKNEAQIHSTITTPEKTNLDTQNPSLYDTRKGSSSPCITLIKRTIMAQVQSPMIPIKAKVVAPLFLFHQLRTA